MISLNGIGPKAAFNILNFGFEKVSALIAEGNVEALIEIPYLNPRMARLIVAELQAKWSKMISPKEAAKISVSLASDIVLVDTLIFAASLG
ncbi:helix-hairpin-helix domain-containing protein, partial [Mycoplasmopsis bovis]|uniref:helix-hairpin-helix domain-containing protein n=1 Tax=Mycoplasmopsis bovis TaxID=28903 RepID=UPI003D29FEBA